MDKPSVKFASVVRGSFAIDTNGAGQIIAEVDGPYVFTLETDLVWVTKWEHISSMDEDEMTYYRKVNEMPLRDLIARWYR